MVVVVGCVVVVVDVVVAEVVVVAFKKRNEMLYPETQLQVEVNYLSGSC